MNVFTSIRPGPLPGSQGMSSPLGAHHQDNKVRCSGELIKEIDKSIFSVSADAWQVGIIRTTQPTGTHHSWPP